MDRSPPRTPGPVDHATGVESTVNLLVRARAGDEVALNHLFGRYLAPLTRWARGRLPQWARQMRDTDDLVQESVMQTLRHVDRFEATRDGGFHAYLRRAVENRLIDEVRRATRAPHDPLASDLADVRPSPIDEAISGQTRDRYQAAIAQLSEEEREAVTARIELGCSYAEIAETIGKTSPDAARMMISRALLKLAKVMNESR